MAEHTVFGFQWHVEIYTTNTATASSGIINETKLADLGYFYSYGVIANSNYDITGSYVSFNTVDRVYSVLKNNVLYGNQYIAYNNFENGNYFTKSWDLAKMVAPSIGYRMVDVTSFNPSSCKIKYSNDSGYYGVRVMPAGTNNSTAFFDENDNCLLYGGGTAFAAYTAIFPPLYGNAIFNLLNTYYQIPDTIIFADLVFDDDDKITSGKVGNLQTQMRVWSDPHNYPSMQTRGVASTTLPSAFIQWLNGLTYTDPIPGEGDDPYSGAGASGPGGGDGTFDFSSTPIDYPGLPTIGAYSTGFLNVYVPSAANLRSLAAYMWAGAFDIDNFRKLVADPMDAIMGLSIVPVTSAEIGVESTTLIVGNISTGISMPRALSQYVAVDCGTIEMPAKWGAYLDFSPYTKLQLYLPYIGFVDISPDDVMTANEGNEDDKLYPGTIGVQYHVDILSGSCIAFVKCRDHVIYEFGGQCACSCPVTEGQYKNGLLGMLEIISTVASTASAVAGGPGEKASKANKAASTIGKVGAVAEGALGVIDSTVSMIKPNITRSGSVGGSNGLMGYQIPYLVLTVPHMCIPGDQNVYIGYPSFVTLTMSDLAGFTQIQVTHLLNMSCTSDEADEIISLLSEGVIF